MSGPKKKKKLKKSVHDIEDYNQFLEEEVHGKGFKGMGKYLKRKFTPTPKHIKQRRKLKEFKSGGSITREDACNVYNYLLNIDHGYRSTDSKKWSFAHPNQVFNFEQLT